MRQDNETPARLRASWLRGAALVLFCLVLGISTYHLWRPQGPTPSPAPAAPTPATPPAPARPGATADPGAWSRLELRLDSGWDARAHDSAAPSPVTLPDLAAMDRPRARVYYTSRFRLPRSLPGAARARLRLEGVFCQSRVYLNKKPLGMGRFPGLPLELEVTGVLRQPGENLLELVVDDREALGLDGLFRPEPALRPGALPSANAFSAWRRAHLRGPVTLVLSGDPGITSARISPSWRKRQVSLQVVLHNGSAGTRAVQLQAALLLRGRRVATGSGRHRLAPGATTVSMVVPVKSPKPWGMPPHGTAQRYTLVLTLSTRAGVQDQLARRVGFREAWTTRDGLWLNGKRLFLLSHGVTPDLRDEVSLEQLLRVSRDHGFNTWHVHFGSTRRELFSLCDELGIYLLPSLVCVGPMRPGYHDGAPFLRDYLRRWQGAFHQHPSVVVWGQELMHTWFPGGQGLELDRPAVDVDIRGLYGTVEALRRFKQRRRAGTTGGDAPHVGSTPPVPGGLTLIHELHRLESLEPLPALLSGFPGLTGSTITPKANVPIPRGVLDRLLHSTPGLTRAALDPRVLPALRITADRELCLLHRPHRAAPLQLGGSLLGRGSQTRLVPQRQGQLKLWSWDGGNWRRRSVRVGRAPMTLRRPEMLINLRR